MSDAEVSSATTPGSAIQTVPASAAFTPEIRRRASSEFGEDGAWLLLSIVQYGWRAFFDLGAAIAPTPALAPVEPPVPVDIAREFDAVRFLHLQGLVYSATEQLATLVKAARAHKPGTTAFFDAFVSNINLNTLIAELAALPATEVGSLVGADQLEDFLTAIRPPVSGAVSLDHRDQDVVRVGDLFVPKSTFDDGLITLTRQHVEHFCSTLAKNFTELRALIDPPEPGDTADPAAPRPHNLRAVDNSFRHGLRVLFHSAAPSPRIFRHVGEDTGDGSVTVYLPGPPDRVRFAGVDVSSDNADHMLDILRVVCTRIGQFSRAFLGYQCYGTAEALVAATGLRLLQSEDGAESR